MVEIIKTTTQNLDTTYHSDFDDMSDYLNGLVPNRYVDAKRDCNQFAHWYREQEKTGKYLNLKHNVVRRMVSCSTKLEFTNYPEISKMSLSFGNFCNEYLLCRNCAIKRSRKKIYEFLPKFYYQLTEKKRKLYFVTLTVKNGDNFIERFDHLTLNYMRMQADARRYKSTKKSKYTEFCKFAGGVYSKEVTYNQKNKSWHPHIHILALLDENTPAIDKEKLSKEWLHFTKDSYIVDSREAYSIDENGVIVTLEEVKLTNVEKFGKAIAEVFKYPLKFSSLTNEQRLHVYESFRFSVPDERLLRLSSSKSKLSKRLLNLKNSDYLTNNYSNFRQMSGSFGCMRGMGKLPASDMMSNFTQFILCFQWNVYKNSYIETISDSLDYIKNQAIKLKKSSFLNRLDEYNNLLHEELKKNNQFFKDFEKLKFLKLEEKRKEREAKKRNLH